MKSFSLEVQSSEHKQVLDITDEVNAEIGSAQVRDGLCHLFVQHTTAALAVGESGEGTAEDLLETAQKMIPRIRFRHAHDPSHAPDHMAASILGPGLTVPVASGRLELGTWQRILLLEFNGPRPRRLVGRLF